MTDLDRYSAGRIFLATCAVAAAVIHLAMVPAHMNEWAAEGIAFALAGWVQIMIAVAVWRYPKRWVLGTAAAVNAAFVGAWFWTRAIGVPWGPHAGTTEAASFIDIVCVVIEGAFVVGALALIWNPSLGKIRGRRAVAAAIVPIAIVAFATAAIASPSARNHTHEHEEGETADGHDHEHAATAEAAGHVHGGDDKGLSLLHNGHHAHMGAPKKLDPLSQARLETQLAITREVAATYPTVAHAEVAGYRRAGGYSPGLGSHYVKGDPTTLNFDGIMDEQDLRHPLGIIYSGNEGTSKIVGFMYYSMAPSAPEGFVGPNDVWHIHKNLCLKSGGAGVVDALGGDDTSPAECRAQGGYTMPITSYMVHVWSVPGWEVTDEHGGMFGEVNPKVVCGDGSYYIVAKAELPDHPLNTCKAGGTVDTYAAKNAAADGHGHDHGTTQVVGSVAGKDDDLGLGMLHNGHHEAMVQKVLPEATQAKLDEQITASREVVAMYPRLRDAIAAGYRRAGPYTPGLGVHYIRYNQYAGNADGVMDRDDILNPMSIIYDGLEPDAKIAGFMYYSFSVDAPEGFVGGNDHWHYHTNTCTVSKPDGTIESPLGADHSATKAQCDKLGGSLMAKTSWMVHVWSVPGYAVTQEHGGIFGEVNPALKCPDGSYYKYPEAEWPDHLENVCKSA